MLGGVEGGVVQQVDLVQTGRVDGGGVDRDFDEGLLWMHGSDLEFAPELGKPPHSDLI